MSVEPARETPSRLRVDPAHPDPADLLAARRILRQGGLIAYPTETFYGLGVDPYQGTAVSKLLSAKGRSADQRLILLVDSLDGVAGICDTGGILGDWLAQLARAFWPGPLTLVLPVGRGAARCAALAGAATVAMRISSHPVARLLCGALGGPLTSTSANRSGMPPAASVAALDPELARALDLIVDGGDAPGGAPSTILDLTAPRPRLLRAGAVDASAIADILGFPPATGT
jgi:L-threonylcarbamoyladenylate synthase